MHQQGVNTNTLERENISVVIRLRDYFVSSCAVYTVEREKLPWSELKRPVHTRSSTKGAFQAASKIPFFLPVVASVPISFFSHPINWIRKRADC